MVIDTDVIKKALIAGTKTTWAIIITGSKMTAGIMKKGFIMGYTRFKGWKKSHRIAAIVAVVIVGMLIMSSLFSPSAADSSAIMGYWVSLDGETDMSIGESKFVAVSISKKRMVAQRISIENKSGKFYCHVEQDMLKRDIDRSKPLIIEVIGKDRIKLYDGSNSEVYIRKAEQTGTSSQATNRTTTDTANFDGAKGRWIDRAQNMEIEITGSQFIAGNEKINFTVERKSGKFYCYQENDVKKSNPLIVEIIDADRIAITHPGSSERNILIRKGSQAAATAAAQDDRPALIRQFNISPTARYKKGATETSTVMHFAAYCNDIPAMKWLMNHGWAVDLLNKEGATPIHEAASGGSLEAMKWLVANGASLRETDNEGSALIHYAARSDNTEILTWLKRQVVNADERNDLGETPAHLAATHGSVNALKWLKNNGAKLNVKDKRGDTPLDNAKLMGEKEAAKWLEENGGK